MLDMFYDYIILIRYTQMKMERKQQESKIIEQEMNKHGMNNQIENLSTLSPSSDKKDQIDIEVVLKIMEEGLPLYPFDYESSQIENSNYKQEQYSPQYQEHELLYPQGHNDGTIPNNIMLEKEKSVMDIQESSQNLQKDVKQAQKTKIFEKVFLEDSSLQKSKQGLKRIEQLFIQFLSPKKKGRPKQPKKLIKNLQHFWRAFTPRFIKMLKQDLKQQGQLLLLKQLEEKLEQSKKERNQNQKWYTKIQEIQGLEPFVFSLLEEEKYNEIIGKIRALNKEDYRRNRVPVLVMFTKHLKEQEYKEFRNYYHLNMQE